MNNHKATRELSESEGMKRLKEKAEEMKKNNLAPPIDSEEPTGLLSGGPGSSRFRRRGH